MLRPEKIANGTADGVPIWCSHLRSTFVFPHITAFVRSVACGSERRREAGPRERREGGNESLSRRGVDSSDRRYCVRQEEEWRKERSFVSVLVSVNAVSSVRDNRQEAEQIRLEWAESVCRERRRRRTRRQNAGGGHLIGLERRKGRWKKE
ncbi:unnamed protein product [Calypogeia fissa]